MADEHTGLGKLIEGDKERDAVHVAIAPVTAGENLRQGQKVCLVGTDRVMAAASPQEWDGIVDPFLTAPVAQGQRFWLWMRPGSITSLRHDWTHPAMERADVADSRRWIERFADRVDHTVEEVMTAARSAAEWGGTSIEGSPGIEVPEDFWRHFEKVSGIKVREDRRSDFFSCSC